MTEPAFRTMTEEEYLRWDGPREGKWEFVDGFVYAQAGASRPHNQIASNIQRVLLPATADGRCWSYASDQKVRVYRDGRPRYYLPDLVVVCDSNLVGEVETTPCLIVEILSASTRAVDESFKASDYRRLDSLQGYLLVDSEARGVEFHRRVGAEWQLDVIDTSVDLPCLGVSLNVDDIYRYVGL
ncbi:Uma2 family endonuclease [Deinococcus multiflagellatus]|uniref:Uma2 family endonuclease n=1 Tax=Deinococcus multiflagellatus TaxID=1656887 RepID=A0ABW1ZNS4_9DEIO|nr:Uma2 family endonuclease [Deinococcus multiflagellatus]MBZ9715107.1 Uma2 family endonuclease [Deinococcus multiflagellatus]